MNRFFLASLAVAVPALIGMTVLATNASSAVAGTGLRFVGVGVAGALTVALAALVARRMSRPNDPRDAAPAVEHVVAGLKDRIEDQASQLEEESRARQVAEERLTRTQRLEILGRLTGGIAHDVNNKLQVVSAALDLLSRRLGEDPSAQHRLLSGLVALDRASELIGRLLSFARQGHREPTVLDLEEHLRSIAVLLEPSLAAHAVTLTLDLDEDLWAIEADPGEFDAAIINLVVNAREAIGQGGSVIVSASNKPAQPTPEPSPEGVRIAVRDDGPGIPSGLIERVTEPFFTTKPDESAIGLGLAQVREFVTGIGGTLVVRSEPGQGAEIVLDLPRSSAARLRPSAELIDEIEDEAAPSVRAEILVVDDEVEVAQAVKSLLEQVGYTARVAIGAEEALRSLESRPPDLVLTDVTMFGGLDGIELGREIGRRRPGLPVLLITGHSGSETPVAEFPVITKPVTSHALDQAIQRHLTPRPAAAVIPFGRR